jgi:ubiquinone/menaquinone biosynthesis C-methylase UbiE
VSGYWQKRRIWDRYEEENDPVIGRIHQEQRELVVNAVRKFASRQEKPITVVDLGCGTGKVAIELMGIERVAGVLAVDINDLALRKVAAGAAQLGLQAKFRFLSGDFYALDWKADDLFDVVVCMDVLHHLPDIPGMLGIILSRVKPGGVFVGNIRAREGTGVFFNRYGLVKRWLICAQPGVDRVLPQKSFLRRWLGSIGYFRIRTFPRAEAEALLRDAGFDIQQFVTGGYHWFVCAPDFRNGVANPDPGINA